MKRILRKLFSVIILGMSLFSGTIYAQSINVDSAKVRVKIGTYITGTNNLIVSNDSGVVNNSGTMIISGNITNSGKIISDGFEYLNGFSDQTITGVFGTSNLGNVFRNQSAGTDVVAGSDLVMRSFDFGSTNGFVDASHPSGRTVRILNSTDTAIKNYSSTKYFLVGDNLGTLERTVSSSSLDTLSFPVGNATAGYRLLDYHPKNSQSGFVGLKIINGSPSASPVPTSYHKHYATGFKNSLFGTGCVPGGFSGDIMFNCLTPHYWSLSTPSSSSEYFVEVFNDACYDAAVGVGTRRVLRVPGITPRSDWFDSIHIQNVIDVPMSDNFCLYSDWTRNRNTIPGGIYQGGGLLAIASGVFYPLPVEITNLTATAGESEILLDWKTASEHNTDKFEVLRSIDAVSFQKVDEVSAHGNSNTPKSYRVDDSDIELGIEYYYQLRQVDYDGKFTLSNIVSARLVGDDIVATLQVYPNPTHGLVYVSEQFDSAILTNIVGQQIRTVQNSNSLLLSDLPAGTYVLQVIIDGKSKSFKIQKL